VKILPPVDSGDPREKVLVTGYEAVRLLKTSYAVICMWRNRGLLPVAGHDRQDRPLYRWSDLFDVEASTRQTRSRGHRGGTVRARREPPEPPREVV